MNRNFGVCFLIFSFGLSSVDAALTDQVAQVQPVTVQPHDFSQINQQMMQEDLLNQDQEMAIKGLIDDNQKLAAASLANKQDAELDKIDQTMIKYRDTILSPDQARIAENIHKLSKYYDLIRLTEDVDDRKGVGHTLLLKSETIEEKYKVLNQLKDEMIALNEKLKGQEIHENFDKISHQQEASIQMLTQKLGDVDKKIAGYDDTLAGKDRQIALLKNSLAQAQSDASSKDATIKDQKGQVDLLKSELENKITEGNGQGQNVELLKSELENKITEVKSLGQKDAVIKQQEDQTAALKAQLQELSSKEDFMKSQADQMANILGQLKDDPSQPIHVVLVPPVFVPPNDLKELNALYVHIQAQIVAIRDKMDQQALDLKAKDESIRWLNQVLSVAKNKAEYYKLTSQQDLLSMQQVRSEVQNIKDDFARRFKDFDQYETAIVSLKDQLSQSGLQVSKKQGQVDLLKSELEHKITEIKNQSRQDAEIEQDLKAQLQGKEDQIVQMKANIKAILQDRANHEADLHNAAAQMNDRVNLAKQLIDLQKQETTLLDEKNNLAAAQNDIFSKHVADLQNHMQDLKNELFQKQELVDLLNTELRTKITQEKDQAVLADQIQDLKVQLQGKEDQITSMNTEIHAGQAAKEEVDSLKQELALAQDKADQLKQQLDSKIAESGKMTSLIDDYQQKLESKDNAYNEQLGQILSAKNDQARMEKQIADLNLQIQDREAQVVKIKNDMYDLQESTRATDMDAQSKDLSLSMMQQKVMDDKIKGYQEKISELQATNDRQAAEVKNLKTQLVLGTQQIEGMPSSDEIDFLRAGLKKATLELTQKNEKLVQIKANADEYVKEFKQQTLQFQTLKDQLVQAQQEISTKNEDLKYKDMALTRLKERFRASESDLKAQVTALTRRSSATDKRIIVKIHGNKVEDLREQLKQADAQIKDLQTQLDQLNSYHKNTPIEEKLKQALDKIDEQGRIINALVQKLEDSGQSVDLVHNIGK